MSLSWKKAFTIAEREYLTTVRRKAFLFTVVGVPALYTALFTLMIKPQMGEGARLMKDFRTLGVVDSSGLFADAAPEIRGTVASDISSPTSARDSFRVRVRTFPSQSEGDRALRAREVNQLLVVPQGYLETGKLRRYALSTNLVSEQDQIAVSGWVARSLLRNRVDPVRIERVARPAGGMELFTPGPAGEYARHDKRRELIDLLMPLAFAMLMGVCIVIGGQYLLQSVAEEKESRILESILCTVNAGELLTGKLIGLGGAGLTIVGSWITMGALLGGPVLALAQIQVRPAILALAVVYFLFGYLFYGSIMTGIGAITSNMREAQQFSLLFTFMNFIPLYMITSVVGHPDSGLALGLSMFPPMAPTVMMLRLSAPAAAAAVPAWQIGLSIALLAGAAWLALFVSARLFRIGLLMYGKTPTLPEILRWVRQS